MPIIYTLFDGEQSRAFKSKDEAAKCARDMAANDSEIDIEVVRVELPPLTLDLIISLIDNQGGRYAQSQEVVYVAKSKTAAKRPWPKPEAPHATVPKHGGQLHESVNGRVITRYPTPDGGVMYAIGGVAFKHLDEAREYARKQTN